MDCAASSARERLRRLLCGAADTDDPCHNISEVTSSAILLMEAAGLHQVESCTVLPPVGNMDVEETLDMWFVNEDSTYRARVLVLANRTTRWLVVDSSALAAVTALQYADGSPDVTLLLVPAAVSKAAKNFGFRRSDCRVVAASFAEVLSLKATARDARYAPYLVDPQEAAKALQMDPGTLAARCALLQATDAMALWAVNATIGAYLAVPLQLGEIRMIVEEVLPHVTTSEES